MQGDRALFRFSAYNDDGSLDTGFVRAIDEVDVARQLAKSGKTPFKVKQVREAQAKNNPRVLIHRLFRPQFDLTRFFSDLSIMLNSGFNIDAALSAVGEAETKAGQKANIATIRTQVTEGKSVSEAFAALDEVPQHVSALVASGESSGRLDRVFAELAEMYSARDERRSKIVEALLYPGFLLLVLVGTILLLSLYLVPAIEPIFDGSNVQTPMIVSALSGLGSLMKNHGVLLLAGAAMVLAVATFALGNGEVRAHFLGRFTAVPILGALLRKAVGGRYLHTMSLLLANGVPLYDSMRLAADTSPIGSFRTRLLEAREIVSGGGAFWKALDGSEIFAPTLITLIRLGEESNNLAAVAGRAAAINDAQLQRTTSRFLSFLTPAVTIILGGMVGMLVISVMTTLLSINEIAVR